MQASNIQIAGTVLFALAVIHTFLVKRFQHIARRFPEGSVGENLFHMLGEVEIVFGFWGGVFFMVYALLVGGHEAVAFVQSLNFTEPAFVFAIMAMAATRPVIALARTAVTSLARMLPLGGALGFYIVALIAGPLLGSFVTEPAAMTVMALLLRDRIFSRNVSVRLKYATLAILLVNVSIGGTLTHFAAPPVLMVAGTWQWDLHFMWQTFGWKSALACTVNAIGAAILFRKELAALPRDVASQTGLGVPSWLTAIHVLLIVAVVSTAHYPAVFVGFFLFFLGITDITREYQDEIKLRDSLLVAFFLAGLVVLGSQQRWWLQPLLESLGMVTLFVGTTVLTAVTDNAALTYLGSQVSGLTDTMKYALVAGAVAGGGLTVIANAPNPAGFSILRDCFGVEGISPLGLLLAALAPTFIAMAALWFL